jgi:hypothetical protein
MSSENFNLNMAEILDRVGTVLKNHRHESIAEALGAAPSTASNWKTRRRIPWTELWEFAVKQNLDFVWLLTGKEPEQTTPNEEDRELMDRYENIIKHYERIIDAQSKQIDSLTKALAQGKAERTPSSSKKANF